MVQGNLQVTRDTIFPINIGERTFYRRFLVVPKLPVPIILGTDFLRDKVEAIKLQDHEVVLLDDQVVPFNLAEFGNRRKLLSQARSNGLGNVLDWMDALVLDTKMEIPAKSAIKYSLPLHEGLKGLAFWALPARAQIGLIRKNNSLRKSPEIYTVTSNRHLPVILVNWGDSPVSLSSQMIVAYVQLVTGDLIRLPDENHDLIEDQKPRPSDEDLEDLFNKADYGDIYPDDKDRLRTLLKECWQQFDAATLDSVDSIQHAIDVVENILTIRCPPYRVGIEARFKIEKQINYLWDQNLVRPSQSPWAFPVVLAKKPNGTRRFCVDFRPAEGSRNLSKFREV